MKLPKHERDLVAVRGLLGRRRRRIGLIGCLETISEPVLPVAPSQVTSRLVTDDAAEPGTEGRRVLELTEVTPGRDEGFLGELLATMEITAGGVSHRTGEPVVQGDQLFESTLIAGGGLADQKRVAGPTFVHHGFIVHVTQ